VLVRGVLVRAGLARDVLVRGVLVRAGLVRAMLVLDVNATAPASTDHPYTTD
jgi:hypothetical protein